MSSHQQTVTRLLHDAANGIPVDADILKESYMSLSAHERLQLLNHREDGGSPTIFYVASIRDTKIFECLMENSAVEENLNLLGIRDLAGDTILHKAASNGHSNTFRDILNFVDEDDQIDVLKHRNNQHETVLHSAVRGGKMDILHSIFTVYDDEYELLCMQNMAGSTAMHVAAISGLNGILELMFCGLDHSLVAEFLRIQDVDQRTALHVAASGKHAVTLALMVNILEPKDGFSLAKVQDKDGDTVFHIAARLNDAPSMEAFNKIKAAGQQTHFLSATNVDGDNALAVAVKGGCLQADACLRDEWGAKESSPTIPDMTTGGLSPSQTLINPYPPELLRSTGLVPSSISQSVYGSKFGPTTSSISVNLLSHVKPTTHPTKRPAASAINGMCDSSQPKMPRLQMEQESQPEPRAAASLSPFVAAPPIGVADVAPAAAPNPELVPVQPPSIAPHVAEAPNPAPHDAEAPNPAPDVAEAPNPAPDVAEAPIPAPDVAEAPIPAPDVVESPNLAPDVAEAPNPAPDGAEAPNPGPVFPDLGPDHVQGAVAVNHPVAVQYAGTVVNNTITVMINRDPMLFPFEPETTIGQFVSVIREECEADVPISVRTSGDVQYSRAMPLRTVVAPFKVIVGNAHTRISEIPNIRNMEPPADPLLAIPQHVIEEPIDTTSPWYRFRFVHTPRQAIELMEHVHNELTTCRAKSINQSLKSIGKSRKTIDRFRFIYYLNAVDNETFLQVQEEWMNNSQRGGICRLSDLCEEVTEWWRVEEAANHGTLTIFGKRRYLD